MAASLLTATFATAASNPTLAVATFADITNTGATKPCRHRHGPPSPPLPPPPTPSIPLTLPLTLSFLEEDCT